MSNPIGFIQAGLAAPNAAATDRYFDRENRTVKVVAFTTKVCDGPQPQCTRRLTGERFAAYQTAQFARWKEIIKSLDIPVE